MACSIQPDIHSTSSTTEAHSSEMMISRSLTQDFVHISIQPSLDEKRSACNICCVVDTSGSMQDAAEIQNDKNEKYGLSQLDLVKHSLNTIIHSLESEDQLSLVSFADKAHVILKLRKMDDAGKKKALEAVEKLQSDGATNLWDGLKTGLELLAKQQDSIKSVSALFLLTDGCPTEIPHDGHLVSLENLKKSVKFLCPVNTFGFGYKLDSKLLEDIAVLGNSGTYAFIPDGSFVGTIFVNAITTLLSTAATNVQLLVHDQGVQNTDYIRWYSTNKTEKGTCIDLGSIAYGQSKDLLIPISSVSTGNCQFTLTYQNAKNVKKSLSFDLKSNLQQTDPNSITRHKMRLEFVHYVRTALENMKSIKADLRNTKQRHEEVMDELRKFEENMRLTANSNDEFIKDLLTDLTGQVREAVEKEQSFNKWGVHYLPSLTRAHLLQFCNNFKDPGVQHYGKGELFSKIRDEMDGIFCILPAPKPSVPTYTYQNSAQASAPVNMAVFYNATGGCLYGECTVRLMNGTTKLVKDVQPGDRMTPHDGMVRFVIKTKCQNQKAKMVIVENDLIITAWHPIRLSSQWIMPCSLVSSIYEISCDTVYNFVLDQGHTVFVNDVECVTLGHGFQEDVVRHAYYGSQRVVKDLEILDAEQNNGGIIEISERALVRSKKTGIVKGLQLQEILVQ